MGKDKKEGIYMSKKQNKTGLCASWATIWAMVSWAIVKRGRALLTVIK